MEDHQERIVAHLRWQAGITSCPITAAVLHAAADDAEAGGPTWATLEPQSHVRSREALGLRLAGAAHRAALAGRAPGYAAHLPSCGGDGDPAGAARAFLELVGSLGVDLVPVQTNEVGRLQALGPALDLLRERLGPLRLLELGASAGLLLHGAGPAAERRGCDPNPLDPASPADRLLLLSFVWPGQLERFRRLEAALDAAAAAPVTVDRAEAGPWLREQLSRPAPGTVVYHSIVWQYLTREQRAEAEQLIAEAGVAWLRFEPSAETTYAETRLTLDGEEHLLATSGFHGQDVTWHGLPT